MQLRHLTLAAVALALAGAPGCIHHHHGNSRGPEVRAGHSGGPPPHAPAHGYRRKHRDARGAELEIVFDTSLGVYLVVGHRDHYWDGKRYFRWNESRWEVSLRLGSHWTRVAAADLPPGLAKKHGHKKHHKHGHHPAKRGR